jgi:hypothetical protein
MTAKNITLVREFVDNTHLVNRDLFTILSTGISSPSGSSKLVTRSSRVTAEAGLEIINGASKASKISTSASNAAM